jgi:hypothetical protein
MGQRRPILAPLAAGLLPSYRERIAKFRLFWIVSRATRTLARSPIGGSLLARFLRRHIWTATGSCPASNAADLVWSSNDRAVHPHSSRLGRGQRQSDSGDPRGTIGPMMTYERPTITSEEPAPRILGSSSLQRPVEAQQNKEPRPRMGTLLFLAQGCAPGSGGRCSVLSGSLFTSSMILAYARVVACSPVHGTASGVS